MKTQPDVVYHGIKDKGAKVDESWGNEQIANALTMKESQGEFTRYGPHFHIRRKPPDQRRHPEGRGSDTL
jgi:hypothetical protein